MKTDKKDAAIELITRFYLNSHNFNGITTSEIGSSLELTDKEVRNILVSLIEEGLVSVVFGNGNPNPHIKQLPDLPKEQQIKKLDDFAGLACVYPTADKLKSSVNINEYAGKPFTLELALGAPQLSFKPFDLRVLEEYRSDPRYYYINNDIFGSISAMSEFSEPDRSRSSDEIVLQTFGFAYDSDHNRAVGVFLRYLDQLTPEHQQIWKSKLLSGDYKLHPCYYRATLRGEWVDCITVFDVVIEDITIINRVCELIGRESLFKEELSGDARPRDFGFLTRPTLRSFNNFVHLLDKVMSENINKGFFQNDIEYQIEEMRSDSKVKVTDKGTIQLLDEWLKLKFTLPDRTPIESAINTFKQVRKLRQEPAHHLPNDRFDQLYFKEQRELMIKVYEAFGTLRAAFCSHPVAKAHKIPFENSSTVFAE
jgi:hypothetical protein